MKVLLTTLNSQYVHSNPALKYLYTVTVDTPDEVSIREFTINNEESYIFGELVRANCDMVCFSCYIWNIERTKDIAASLKKAMPEVKICLGGPEVSFNAHIFAMENPWADYILCGEGEYSFYRLLEVLRESGEGNRLATVPGLVYRDGGKIYVNPQMEPMNFNSIPFLYSMVECETDKVIYYESSRGCPFRCSYCLSSIEKSVRTLRLLRKLAQTLDSSDRILSLKDVTTRDEDVSTGSNQTRSCLSLYATIYLDKCFRAAFVYEFTKAFHLVYSILDEFLSAKTWVNTHQEHHIRVANNVFKSRDRSGRIERYASFHSSIMNLLDSAMKVSSSLNVYIHHHCSELCRLLNVAFRFVNHVVYVEFFSAHLSHGFHDRESE